MFRVFFLSQAAQVELNSGRVSAPASYRPRSSSFDSVANACLTLSNAEYQGLTIVHFSAQHKRFLWDRGCGQGLLGRSFGGVRGCWEVFRVCFCGGCG